MNFNDDTIIEPNIVWKMEGDNVEAEIGGQKIIFNDSATIIWRKIDGFKTIYQIREELISEYSSFNSEEDIIKILNNCINLFHDNKLILARSSDLFGEWLV